MGFPLLTLVARWNDQAKSGDVVVEENGRKVRATVGCTSRSVISQEGFSTGVHSWIIEFGSGDLCSHKGWAFNIVC